MYKSNQVLLHLVTYNLTAMPAFRLNEPAMRQDMNDQHSPSGPVPGDVYRKVAKAAMEAIRKENSGHLVIAGGNSVGNAVIPEIADLDIAQSCRGYFPHAISHYKAPWANKDPDSLPEPVWPGKTGNHAPGGCGV